MVNLLVLSFDCIRLYALRLHLGLEKFGGKKKKFRKVTFLCVFGSEKITKKKKYGEKLDRKIVRNK